MTTGSQGLRSRRRRWGLALVLAVSGGCLVFNGKVATDDGGTPPTDASGGARDATPDVSKRDASVDASRRDAATDAFSEAGKTPDAARDASPGFCALPRDGSPLLCLDFDDASSPDAFFQSVTTTDGASVTLDTPDGAPSPPHTLRISLPGLDSGTASAYGQVSVGFVKQPKAIECTFAARYDLFDTSASPGGVTDPMLSLGLQGQNIQSLDIEVFETLLLAQGFVTGADGSLATVYSLVPTSFVWTRGVWASMALSVSFEARTASLTIGSTTWDPVSFPSLDSVSGVTLLLGGSQSGPNSAYKTEFDNVLCYAE